jgi:octaprenyl-diphosphate synthase
LFGLSCDLGSSLAGANGAQRVALRQFGLGLGTAYQVYDDCVDLFGNEEVAGKSLGTDLAKGKLTLPLLVALEHASPSQASEFRTLINRWDGRHTRRLRQLLDLHEALPACRSVIHGFLASARQQLFILEPSPHREALDELAQFLAKQTDELGV